MNLNELHTPEKGVSSNLFFKGEEGTVVALQILRNQKLKEHITKVPAILICVEGKVGFENENDIDLTLFPGDYVAIEPMVKHWITGIVDSQLVLIK